MTRRRTMGLNIVRHEQMRSQRGGILPMGAPIPAVPLLPMEQAGRGFFARVLGR